MDNTYIAVLKKTKPESIYSREYSREMEHLGSEVRQVTRYKDNQWFDDPNMTCEPRHKAADQAIDYADSGRDKHDDKE